MGVLVLLGFIAITASLILILPKGIAESFVLLLLFAEIGVLMTMLAEILTTLVAEDAGRKLGTRRKDENDD